MFEKTFHYCAVGLAHVGIDGTFIRVNKKLCEFLDYSDQELTKLTFQDLTAPDNLDEDIVNHMNGNYCRCMAYTRIKKAIKRAATSSVQYFDPNATSEGENA